MSLQAAAHNAGLPINCLPPELLMIILYDARRCLEDIRLAHVCHQWRTLLLAMPEFWASMFKHLQVSFYLGDGERVRYFLGLSSPHTLKMDVYMGQFAVELLAPHASRIVQLSVRLISADSIHYFDTVLSAGLPNLTKFRYHSESIIYGAWRPSRPFTDCSLPALRQVHIPAIFPLANWVTPTVEEITLQGYSSDMRDLIKALELYPSVKSLTFLPDTHTSQHIPPFAPVAGYTERPLGGELRSLHRLYLAGSVPSIIDLLAQLNVPPSVHLQLRCDDVGAVIAAPGTVLSRHIFPALARLYLGRTHRSGVVRLLGYARSDGQDEFTERLNVAIPRDWTAENALAELLRPFAASGATALAIDLPRLPPLLEASVWGQPSGVGADSDNVFLLPRALNRMELLGGTPGAVKVRFARGFIRNTSLGASAALTLCWVLDVARERALEERAREELERLQQLLEEIDAVGRRLGRLELYGTLQSWVVATRASEVSTYARRCTEVAGSFLPRFEELVDTVVLV
ncbi:uncharacterized protein TRAVEDRAFT_46226 [Trametes versicolor FP-101664 SS1]|uniref:uncharacterized protein n=1 Tax=Trametes versicolor (strain FP-101664) TaxID=717944 RepID=UPI0004621DC5|nr:uncharacterized protein TRAVEDRAFT_46226 [Trametes versicolor FP-101664 SS1]EIW60999.1 hypothetical protein TRAVEDRAFT_46226 [Trametes versicolor FP-101664 SS1]